MIKYSRVFLIALSLILVFTGGFLLYQSVSGSFSSTVVVEWSTASELETVGFNLYRAETDAGPFEKINPDLIPASPDSLTGGSYKFEDSGVRAGKVYFYKLEDVEYSGITQMFGPIEVKATGGGLLEMILAAALCLAGSVSMVMSIRQKNSIPITEAADVP